MSELTKRIRAKHPEYADLDDDTLEEKVLAKYPQYLDLADPKRQQPPIRVNMPDGRVINFPATMGHDEITKVIGRDFRPDSGPSRPPLTRDQFNAVRQRVIDTAPDGLSRDQFNALMDNELGKAERLQGIVERMVKAVQHTEGKPSDQGLLSRAGDMIVNSPEGYAVRKIAGIVKRNPVAAGAMAGSALAAPLTGGMSLLPAAALVGLGGAGGAAYGQLAKGAATDDYGTSGGNAREIATEGGLSALGEGGARAVAAGARRLGPVLREQAVSAYDRMLKPTKAAMRSVSQYGDTLPERARNVAAAILDQGVSITQAGARKIHDRISQLADQASSIIANSDKRAPTSYIADALGEARDRAAQQLAPGADVAAVDAVENSVRANPQITKRVRGRKLMDTGVLDASGQPVMKAVTLDSGQRVLLPTATVQKLDALKRGTYRAIGDRAYGETQGAAVEAEKAAARGARRSIESVEPTVGPIHQAESKLIDASGVLDDAVFRSGKHNPFGLTEGIALAGHRPIWALPALLNRPGIGSPVARAVNAVGRKLATAEPPANLVRAALIALMGQDQDRDPQQPEQR